MTIAPKPIRNYKLVVACFNADERYVYEERLGILCGTDPETPEAAAYAIQDVRRFQAERNTEQECPAIEQNSPRNDPDAQNRSK